MSDRTTVQRRIANWFVDRLNLEIPSPEIDLFETGVLDSLGFVELLVYLEQERRCCTATRNQRLASIHALARFIGEHSPQHVEWCAQVRMVPMKKGTTTSLTYLEKSEMDALLAAPDQSSTQGRRDHGGVSRQGQEAAQAGRVV